MAMKTGNGVGLLLTIVLIALIVLFVFPSIGIYALLVNTLVGFIAIFLVNAIFGLGIKYDLLVLVFVAFFGLLAVAILIILNIMGDK